jgi:hypothetical protein
MNKYIKSLVNDNGDYITVCENVSPRNNRCLQITSVSLANNTSFSVPYRFLSSILEIDDYYVLLDKLSSFKD